MQKQKGASIKMGDHKLSRFLAKLLRHDAKTRGLTVTPEGYVDIEEILRLGDVSRFSVADVEKVVNHDKKGRFQIRTYQGRKQIKATQGHSFELDDSDLIPITHYTDARVVLHGTKSGNWPAIKSQGLSKMGRQYIHFAPGESNVKSDGIKFYKSANDVINCPGNTSGILSPKYFKRAYNIRTRDELPL